MKKLLYLVLIFGLFSCQKIIEKPKNLLQKDQMSTLIAELAIIDQLGMVNSNYTPNTQTLFIFKKYKADPKNFIESYKYYVATGDMQNIYDEAQDLIKKRDPKAKKYIDKKIAEQDSVKKATEKNIQKMQNQDQNQNHNQNPNQNQR